MNVNKIRSQPMDNFYLKSSSKGMKYLYIGVSTLIALIITAPLFIIVYRYFPSLVVDFGLTIRIDMLLSFILVFVPTFTLIRFLNKKFVISFVIFFLFSMTIVQLLDIYSFNQIKKSYLDILNYVETNPVKVPFLSEHKMTIRNAEKIKEAIDYQNTEVRNFAIEASLRYFNEEGYYGKYGNIIRYFSVFKTINQWNYVPDPKGLDYFAKASESINHLGGDCDDHSILMAACIKAIGGEVRLIHTEGHLYPEVKIGSVENLSTIFDLIKRDLFYKESMGNQIFYRVDFENNVWLNFDYTGKYPGAKYLDNKIIGILNI